ncbi:MAG: GIY-YIG nuclease family protein [Candidatus Odinarchaeia archaeon]
MKLTSFKGRELKGVYAMIIKIVKHIKVVVGKFGETNFVPGIYVYVGSAVGRGAVSLTGRIMRHLAEKKSLHWHIDYLLSRPEARILNVIYASTNQNMECLVSKKLLKTAKFDVPVNGFGSSDCKNSCPAHFFRSTERYETTVKIIKRVFNQLGLREENLIID